MAKGRRTRDQKRKKKLQERKRKERPTQSLAYMGEKYKTDELIPTWMHTEIGIYETYVMTDRKLLDQTVVAALESLMRQIQAGTLPPFEDASETHYEVGREEDLVIENIRRSWARHFADEWKPPRDKLVGVLRTILGSIAKVRAPGPRSQSYMRHIAGFLTKKLGVSVKSFSQNMEPIPDPPEDDLLRLGRQWILEENYMKLRSDTIGHVDTPGDVDLDRAFAPGGSVPRNNDIVKLEREDGDYLSAWHFADGDDWAVTIRKQGTQLRMARNTSPDETLRIFKVNGRVRDLVVNSRLGSWARKLLKEG